MLVPVPVLALALVPVLALVLACVVGGGGEISRSSGGGVGFLIPS